MILMLNNRDSFVFNLARYLTLAGADVEVKDSRSLSLKDIVRLRPEAIVISPGPSRPEQAGISVQACRYLVFAWGIKPLQSHMADRSGARVRRHMDGPSALPIRRKGCLLNCLRRCRWGSTIRSLSICQVLPDYRSMPQHLTVRSWRFRIERILFLACSFIQSRF